MGYERIKSEHAGPKNGGGAWMTRAEAKESARRKRRKADKRMQRLDECVAFSPTSLPTRAWQLS
jgi:hypothetical protein